MTMPSREECIRTFEKLGIYLQQVADALDKDESVFPLNQQVNPWFITCFISLSLKNWAKRFSSSSIQQFFSLYPELPLNLTEKHVGVIPEENVPLAGLQEIYCILLTGNHFYCRNVNHGNDLLELVTKKIIETEPAFGDYIHWVDTFPKSVEHFLVSLRPDENVQKIYFQKRHSLIREKRLSAAILTGHESKEDLRLLADDIFQFFGLSSRNVRKILVPESFSFPSLFEAFVDYSWIYRHNKYANNYDYHQSVFLMERIPFLDNGFFILRESPEQVVPLGCLYYEYYNDPDDLSQKIGKLNPHLQSIASEDASHFGSLHRYPLWEYENHLDIIRFLTQ